MKNLYPFEIILGEKLQKKQRYDVTGINDNTVEECIITNIN